jgi:tRNA(Arg) A34 adenosine deaminase TadA
MSDYIERNIEILRKAAIDIVNPVRSYRVAASLVYKRRIVSFGINRYKTSPIQNRFKKNENAIYLHAEVACVKNALRHLDVEDFKKCDMFVVRVKRLVYEGDFVYAMAKPCEGCSRCIAEFGIRDVYYTVEDPNETWRKM